MCAASPIHVPRVTPARSRRRPAPNRPGRTTPPQSEGNLQNSHAHDFDPHGDCLVFLREFKRRHRSARRVTVCEFVGDPVLPPVESVPLSEMMGELERLLGELEAHAIRLHFPTPMTALEMYRFITEELFRVVIADVRIPGMTHHFSYEDIHAPRNILGEC